MQNLRIGIFAYNFKHRKTQDVLVRCYLEQVPVQAVFAADKVELDIPDSTIRTSVRHQALIHPKQVAARLGYPYFNVKHDGPEILSLFNELNLDIGIISGARILPPEVIDQFRYGIINFHPGLIPESRGLDALLWSIYQDIPPGVTAHLIDEQVDAGKVLIRHHINVFPDDTLFDLSERTYETQLEIFKPAIQKAAAGEWLEVETASKPYHRKIPPEKEQEVLDMVDAYIEKYSSG